MPLWPVNLSLSDVTQCQTLDQNHLATPLLFSNNLIPPKPSSPDRRTINWSVCRSGHPPRQARDATVFGIDDSQPGDRRTIPEALQAWRSFAREQADVEAFITRQAASVVG